MAVYKEEKTNTWRAVYRYTDWNGELKQTQKRGFKTKREAQAWEREQLNKTSADLDMTFKSFVDMGFSVTAIADRVGHESIDITYNYAHLFPSKQAEMADKLNMERGN